MTPREFTICPNAFRATQDPPGAECLSHDVHSISGFMAQRDDGRDKCASNGAGIVPAPFPCLDLVLNCNARTYRPRKTRVQAVLAPRDLLASATPGHGIAVSATGSTLRRANAPAPLDGIVDANHHLAVRRQHRQEMEQQSTRRVASVPACPVERSVVLCLIKRTKRVDRLRRSTPI